MTAETLTHGHDTGRWEIQHDLDLHDSPELAQKIAEYVEQRLEKDSVQDSLRRDISTDLEKALDETLGSLTRLIQDVEDGTVDGDRETLEEIYTAVSSIPDRVLNP